ncbi:hypothetical protein PMI09_02791 [Rhizobium sp. CF122]|uniref:hypothetical protein n=1 Tax=Rhizobium sp. CF122 TaxID=1144312 RepID=UPI000271CAE8|nr:hypothetical protein [Rhizobium sp. CF122]EJL53926.1 hypothetical protein PMI09_02791 [Rhizobium sp. CF122]
MSKRYRGRFKRSARDLYDTPLRSVLPVIPFLRASGVRDFAEPCAGNGKLIGHLQQAGFTCASAGDIATGQDALAVTCFAMPVVTNPPFSRDRLLPLIEHFIAAAPSVWLLLPADFAHVAYARPYLRHCSDIVAAGREAWFGGGGTENIAWYRFDRRHHGLPLFHNGTLGAGMACASCGRSFSTSRSDARTCSATCRQRLRRKRLLTSRDISRDIGG